MPKLRTPSVLEMEVFILKLRKPTIKKIEFDDDDKSYLQSEMCKKLGLSKNTVSERVKNLEKNIKENFVNRTFY